MKATLDDNSFGQQTDVCAEWFERAYHGDEAAAVLLYEYCVPMLRCWLKTRMSEIQAADLAHDAMVHAFRKHALFRSGSVFMPWLKTIALRLALNQIRDENRERSRIQDWVDQQSLHSSEDDSEIDQRIRAMNDCLYTLPEPQRQWLHLHYVEGQTSQAIAEAQGRKRSAVAVGIHRVCRSLRSRLQFHV